MDSTDRPTLAPPDRDTLPPPARDSAPDSDTRLERVVHDLSNVLTPLLVLTGHLEPALPLGHPLRERLADIEDAARRAQQIVQRAANELVGKRATPAALSVSALLLDLKRVLESTCGREIELSISDVSPSISLVVDRYTLETALVDLVANARDAIQGAGEIRIRATAVLLGEYAASASRLVPGPYVVIEVWDSGSGIPRELQSRIFDRFFTTKPAGTGLGLWNVRSFVERTGGKVLVSSAPGQGTTFALYLPQQGH